MPSSSSKFTCSYSLDERCEEPLVQVNQEAYRLIQSAFAPQYRFAMAKDGKPEAVQTWLVFYAVRIYGAADAALTLVLHNMTREAIILQRQIFEYVVRARYYVANPEDARLERETFPLRHLDMMNKMRLEKGSDHYTRVVADCEKIKLDQSDVYEYFLKHKNGPASIRTMIGPESDPEVTADYAANYSFPSGISHGGTLSLTDVYGPAGISFDSSTDDPNWLLVVITGYILLFLELAQKPLGLNVQKQIDGLKGRLKPFEGKYSTESEVK
jgi:uncharacterized protein DUF5677